MARQVFAAVRTLVFATLFLSLWTYFLPRWLGAQHPFDEAQPLGWFVVAAGASLALPSMWTFAWQGLGTPAIFDPPRRLVVTGPYRFMRNPMYTGAAIMLIGEALTFPRLTMPMLVTLALFVVMTNAFVLVYEEPHLRAKFGDDYNDYCSHVRRWIPRLSPWYSHAHLD